MVKDFLPAYVRLFLLFFVSNLERLCVFQSSKFKVQSSRFKVQGSRFKVQGSKFKVQGSRFKVQGSKHLLFEL